MDRLIAAAEAAADVAGAWCARSSAPAWAPT